MVKKELTQLNFLIEHYKDGKKRVTKLNFLVEHYRDGKKRVYPSKLLDRAL